jgi:hypothetical protein
MRQTIQTVLREVRNTMRHGMAVIVSCVLLTGSSAAASELSISPVYQQTPLWCWAAVGEMVFEHYGVANINPYGNFQCGIIALLHPVCNQSCGNCVVGAGSLDTMTNMITRYPTFASGVTSTSTRIRATPIKGRLSFDDLQNEIDAGRPIVAGISPSGYRHAGVSEHVALIVGYDGRDLIVNDPFPFATAFSGDPYEAAGGEQIGRGQYQIRYSSFANDLQWRETIYGIRCSGSDCADVESTADNDESEEDDYEEAAPVRSGRSCVTPVTRCGPFYNQAPLPLGSPCWCATPYGPSSGKVTTP